MPVVLCVSHQMNQFAPIPWFCRDHPRNPRIPGILGASMRSGFALSHSEPSVRFVVCRYEKRL